MVGLFAVMEVVAALDRWRREQSLARTLERRPELLEAAELDAADHKFLDTLKENTDGREH